MPKRIIDGERWLAERRRFLREQLESGDLTDHERTLIETELDGLRDEWGIQSPGYRWRRLRRRLGRRL